MTTRYGSLGAVLGLFCCGAMAAPAVAADLPYGPGGGYAAAAGWGVAAHPYFAEASRFDIYGYPVVLAAPNPLYASTGCPPVLQPIYDATGNFAGYNPIQACR